MKKLHTFILVIALLLLILVGCSGPKTQTDEARVYVEDFLNLLKTNDFELLMSRPGEKEDDSYEARISYASYNAVFHNMTWNYVAGEMEDGKGELVYTVMSRDIDRVVQKIEEAARDGVIDLSNVTTTTKILEDYLKNIPAIEKEVVFKMIKENTEYHPENGREIMNIILGAKIFDESQ